MLQQLLFFRGVCNRGKTNLCTISFKKIPLGLFVIADAAKTNYLSSVSCNIPERKDMVGKGLKDKLKLLGTKDSKLNNSALIIQ